MLKLSKLLKNIFRSVIFLLLVLEIILLMSILLIYRNNTEDIKVGLQTNIKSGVIKYRDLFVTYLADKYYMLSEDLIFLLRTVESILDNNEFPLNNNLTDIETNCMVNGQRIYSWTNTSSFSPAWYNTREQDFGTRLLGTWFTTREQMSFNLLSEKDRYYIQSLCSIKRLYRDILTKHLNWKDYLGVTNDQFYFAFSDSFFVKFPAFTNSYMTGNPGDWTDTSRKSSCKSIRDLNTYDPICRTFYQDILASQEKITISAPYRFASTGLYGSSLCSRGKRYDSLRQLPEVVACIDYNFKDMDLFGLDLQSFLESKRIFVVQLLGSIIKVIFSTSVKSIDFTSFGSYLGLNKTDGNDFFEVLNYGTFKQMNNSLDYSKIDLIKLKTLNYTDLKLKGGSDSLPTSFTTQEKNYVEFCMDYIELSNKYQEILANLSTVFKTITPSEIINNKLNLFEQAYSYEFSNVTNQIIMTKNVMQIFSLPIPLSFDYIQDYNIVKNNNTKFFFLFVQNPDSIQIIDSFYMNILFSMIFSFISVCFLNFIIWVVIGSCYYFYFKAILAPLKKINREFKELVFVKEKNVESSLNDVKKKRRKTNLIDPEEQPRFIESFENRVLTFFQKSTIDLTEYDEIYDALITLKVLRTIREYKLISAKNVKLNKIRYREEHMEEIMRALLYLMFKLSDNIVDDIHFDSRLIADLIYHNFMFKIAQDESEKNVTFFYEYFTNLIDKTIENSEKNFSKQKKFEVLKNYEENRVHSNKDYVDVEKFVSKSNTFKNLKEVYQSLKEDIQYRYCVYKLKSMEKDKKKDVEDKHAVYTSSDEEPEADEKVNTEDEKNLLEDSRTHFKSAKQRAKTLKVANQYQINTLEDEEIIINMESDMDTDERVSIRTLISDFLKYFQISNTNEISLNTLKHISVHIILANLYFEIDKESDCLKQCTLAMEKIKNMQEKVSNLGNLTKFSFLSICVLFYEKMFYIFSKLCQKFDQRKTQFFIYLKLLDLGPIFDSRIRVTVFQNVMDFMHRTEVQKLKTSAGKLLGKKDEKAINSKIIRHKIRAMMNMTMKVPKFITYLIDINCPFLKEKDFQYMLDKIATYAPNCLVNFVLFNETLIFNKINKHHDFNFIFEVDPDDYKNSPSRLDKAIEACMEEFQYNEFPKNNNYLFVLTNIDATFDMSIENLTRITLQVFKSKYSVILLLFWDDKIYDSPDLKKKLHQLRKWIENNTNGILIIIKNYSVIKQLLTCVHPLKFKEFDPIVLRNLVTSIDLNLHLESVLAKKHYSTMKSTLRMEKILMNESTVRDFATMPSNETFNEELIYFIN